jgi:3-hydroxyacyl-[acyl-carrier-protein] dehydratase
VKGKEAIGVKNLSTGEEFFINHYARFPVFPEPLIIEAIAQVGGWAITASRDYCHFAMMVMIDRVTFLKFVHPGDQLILKVEITENHEFGAAIRGTALVKEEVVARIERIYYTLFEIPKVHKERIKRAYMFASGKFSADEGDE